MMRTNASLFRSYARIEDAMTRAAMPRTSLADPVTFATITKDYAARCWRDGVLSLAAIPALTITLEEVARG